ncbi:MAG: hypothetical protein V4707_07685 [Pseudomonadota bacterium]
MAGRDRQLLALLADDHAENRNLAAGTPAYDALRARDRIRREQVMALIAGGWPSDPEAIYAAAWVLNHGDTPDEAFLGHRLAVAARDLGHGPARWLAAAALDRSLMYAGKPQKYGTNMVPDSVAYRVWDVDPATTDAERAEHDVPPLVELQARAAALTGPQPDMTGAPGWLKAAIRRWRKT